MIKKLSLLFVLVAALPANALAWIGGPFDNGDYSAVFDDSGIYQASIRFKNGSGFAQWGSNVTLRVSTTGTTGAAAQTNTTGSVLNRSVIYARGITYIGIASGMVDTVNNVIIGQTNGASDGTQAGAQAADGGAGGGTTDVIASNGGRRFTANTYFRAKITQKHPVLKFSGNGQITLLGPDASSIISDIADEIVGNINDTLTPQPIVVPTEEILLNPIINSDGETSFQEITVARDIQDVITDQQAVLDFAITNARQLANAQINTIELVRDYLANSPAAKQDVVTEKITVFGTRKFFLSTR